MTIAASGIMVSSSRVESLRETRFSGESSWQNKIDLAEVNLGREAAIQVEMAAEISRQTVRFRFPDKPTPKEFSLFAGSFGRLVERATLFFPDVPANSWEEIRLGMATGHIQIEPPRSIKGSQLDGQFMITAHAALDKAKRLMQINGLTAVAKSTGKGGANEKSTALEIWRPESELAEMSQSAWEGYQQELVNLFQISRGSMPTTFAEGEREALATSLRMGRLKGFKVTRGANRAVLTVQADQTVQEAVELARQQRQRQRNFRIGFGAGITIVTAIACGVLAPRIGPANANPTETPAGNNDQCFPGMKESMDNARNQIVGSNSAISPGLVMPAADLNAAISGNTEMVNRLAACIVEGSSSSEYQLVGVPLVNEKGDIILEIVRPMSDKTMRSFVAVFPNEANFAAQNGPEKFLAALVAEVGSAQSNGSQVGEIETFLSIVQFDKNGEAVKDKDGQTIKMTIRHDPDKGDMVVFTLGGVRQTEIPLTALNQNIDVQKLANNIISTEKILSGETQIGVPTDHLADVDGFVMNGESSAVNLSIEALKMLNEMGFGVSNVDGGQENPHIVNWENGKFVRISPTEFLFAPHGELIKPPAIDANGMLFYQMDDGTRQKVFIQLPKIDGGKWVLVYNLVGSPNPGKTWVAFVEDIGGKSGAPKFIGKLEAIHPEADDTQIRLKDGRVERLLNGQVVEGFDFEPTPSLPPLIAEYVTAHPDATDYTVSVDAAGATQESYFARSRSSSP